MPGNLPGRRMDQNTKTGAPTNGHLHLYGKKDGHCDGRHTVDHKMFIDENSLSQPLPCSFRSTWSLHLTPFQSPARAIVPLIMGTHSRCYHTISGSH